MHYYPLLSRQPYHMRFVFKPDHQDIDQSSNEALNEPGSVIVKITVNNIRCAPLDTQIRSTLGIFNGRRSARPAAESNELTKEIGQFISLINEAHARLERIETMDGHSMMETANVIRKEEAISKARIANMRAIRLKNILTTKSTPY
ncbi:hypothetical protein [Spirosoma pulveris]